VCFNIMHVPIMQHSLHPTLVTLNAHTHKFTHTLHTYVHTHTYIHTQTYKHVHNQPGHRHRHIHKQTLK